MGSERLYLDVNIFLDYFLQRKDKQEAEGILALADSGEIEAFTSPLTLHSQLRKAFSLQDVCELLLGVTDNVQMVSPSRNQTRLALENPLTDIEDSLHYYTALEHNCQYFISNDRKLAKKAVDILPVLSPGEYLRRAQE